MTLDDRGQPIGMVASCLDVTARKAGERRLAHFSAIVSSSHDAIYSTNLDGEVTFWNSGAERLYGYTAAEMLGRSLSILLPTERSDEMMTLRSRVKNGERVENYDTVRRRKNGTLVDVTATISPLMNSNGEIIGVSGIAHDITNRKQAEHVLRESEDRYRTLVENIDLGITLIDKQHRIVTINTAQTRMHGRSVEAFVGHECFRVFEKRDAVCAHCPGVRAMQTGLPAEAETKGVRDDGSTFAVRVQTFPIRDTRGEPTGFVEIVEDITDRKRTEAELIGAKQAAEAANRAKSAVSGEHEP